MEVSGQSFFAEARKAIDYVEETQMQGIQAAARLLGDCLAADGVVHIFGTGHSQAFSMEMAGRAGGLVPMDMIALVDLVKKGVATWDDLGDPKIERDPEWGRKVLTTHNVRPGDAFIIVSNSGRNGSTVEMALEVKRRGLPLVVVTSLKHSTQVSSRHPSGKKLYEIADVTIDNGGPFGDALLDLQEGLKVCAISSVTGATIAQALTAEIARLLMERGLTPPVLISANVDGSDVWNEGLRAKYADRINR